MVPDRSGAGNTGAIFLFDRFLNIGYNMLNKTADKEGQGFPFRQNEALSRAAYLTRTERLYLFFRFRIATIKRPTVMITMNSSYVLISVPPFRKTRNGSIAALPAARLSILGCQCSNPLLKIWYGLCIICLTREPMTSVHLAAGKNMTTKSSALSYQDEGATFCV